MARQFVPRLARLLAGLSDERTPPGAALEQAEAVCGALRLLDRAGLDPESGGTRFLAPSLRGFIEKIRSAATTPDHRDLLRVLTRVAEGLETPTGAQGQ